MTRQIACVPMVELLEPRTLLAAITGMVVDDINDNGFADLAPDGKIGEAGVPGWAVYVDYNGNSALDAGEPSAVTGAYGAYSIADVTAGSYFVHQVPRAGRRLGQAAVVATVTDSSDAAGINFASTAKARIGGKVFYDVNADGQKDAGDYPLVGWGVYIDANNNGRYDPIERRVLTKADGSYVFTNLDPDQYDVRLIIPGNWSDQPTNRPSNLYRPNVTTGAISRDRSFGVVPGGIITGIVFNYWASDDHQRHDGQAGVPDIEVYIDDDNNGVPDSSATTATTNELGIYRIEGLALGTHRIRCDAGIFHGDGVMLTLSPDHPIFAYNPVIVF